MNINGQNLTPAQILKVAGIPTDGKQRTMTHHPDCDVNDVNPDGITKPCNCGFGDLQAEFDRLHDGRQREKERADRAEACAAERGAILELTRHYHIGTPDGVPNSWFIRRDKSLSSSCGQGWTSPDEAQKLQASNAAMREVLEWWQPNTEVADGKRRKALATDAGQPLLDRLKAMEEILESLEHSIYLSHVDGENHCMATCVRCRWEKVKGASK